MKISRLKIAYTSLNVVLFVSVLFVSVTTSKMEYDPWLDVTEDGYGGIDDIVTVAEHFGATGDTTRNVNVTNWPRGTAVTVAYSWLLVDGMAYASDEYNANGFRYMHILMEAAGLSTGETVDIVLYSRIYLIPQGVQYREITCYTITLTSTFTQADVVTYVPSEFFYFVVDAATGTSCTVWLNYYLS